MLKIEESLQYDKPIQFGITYQNDRLQRHYLEKNFFKSGNESNQNHYFIKIFTTIDGKSICMGYIYFNLDFATKESKFIGIFVAEEFRSQGISTTLMSEWLKLCWENNFHKFSTNKKQRKPFIIHNLKKFGFEIEDEGLYDQSPHTIFICKKMNSSKKYLLFKNETQKTAFMASAIYTHDNYIVLSGQKQGIPIIDQVLLSRTLSLTDLDKAEKRAGRY